MKINSQIKKGFKLFTGKASCVTCHTIGEDYTLFTDEQLQMTQRFIVPEYWANKFKSYPADHLFVQETAKEARIE